MNLTSLKIVTKEPIIQRSTATTIEDTPLPVIHAVARERLPRRARRLDVDDVLARSVPKTAVEILPLNEE